MAIAECVGYSTRRGEHLSKDISGHIKTIFEFEKMSVEDLENIEGIGPKVAQSIFDFFQNQSKYPLAARIEKNGREYRNPFRMRAPKTTSLMEKLFFTGSLQFSRDRANELVEANGGKLLSSVSANLNYLVVGEDVGSKLAKAKDTFDSGVDRRGVLKMVE